MILMEQLVGRACLAFLLSTITQGVLAQVTMPGKYNIIGPFVIGEREEGVDTLESYVIHNISGGIFNLSPDNRTYPSELGNGGMVGWSTVTPSSNNNVQILYPEIDWEFLQTFFGWSIWLWYGYAVGSFEVSTTGRYLVQCTGGVRLFWIDQSPFLGDFYSYGVGGHPVTLTSGTHHVILRLTSSVRLTQSPVVNFNFQVSPITQPGNIVIVGDTTVPYIVNGYLASPYISVTVTNINNETITNAMLTTDKQDIFLVASPEYSIAPGQKFALTAELGQDRPITCPFSAIFGISYLGSSGEASLNISFTCAEFGSSAYSFTFLDFDNTVQYASVVPPNQTCGASGCGVMMATHGAGVEAQSPAWTGAIPQQNSLWMLFPTGRRSWGYDWESSSRINAFGALDYLAQNLPGVPKDANGSFVVDPASVLYVGHSMGGHGCWSLASHFGDRAIAAACAAGFVKLQFYVFYNTRAGDSLVDPILRGILDASIAENDNDVYTTNLVGIPTIARYGQNDSNVCPWHSRRMARMVDEESNNPHAVIISEVPNENHWFTGVLGDSFMVDFYESHTGVGFPELPTTFTLSAVNPASFGGRGNFVILQLSIPFRVGRITVTQQSGIWILNTTNIRRFGFNQNPIRRTWPKLLIVDGIQFDANSFLPNNLCNSGPSGQWAWCSEDYDTLERSPLNYGPFRQIFEQHFVIVYGTGGSTDENEVAMQSAVTIANFFNMYGRGSPMILSDTQLPSDGINHHAILVGGPHMNKWSAYLEPVLPVKFSSSSSWTLGPKAYSRPCQGTLFLSPASTLPYFVAVVAGTDSCGLSVAVRAMPQRSGVVVADYMVLDSTFIGKGAGGVLAAGYWDNDWKFSYASGYA